MISCDNRKISVQNRLIIEFVIQPFRLKIASARYTMLVNNKGARTLNRVIFDEYYTTTEICDPAFIMIIATAWSLVFVFVSILGTYWYSNSRHAYRWPTDVPVSLSFGQKNYVS